MGYVKRDGRPQAGRRSKVLQVRIGPTEYATIKQASIIEDVSLSEYLRGAAAEHAHRLLGRNEAAERIIAACPQSAPWSTQDARPLPRRLVFRAGVVGIPLPCTYNYPVATTGYLKRDGRPQVGRRSKVLQIRISPIEYAAIKQASIIEGVSLSEYLRGAAAEHAHRGKRSEQSAKLASAPAT